jgi:hypothetical protein
VAWSLEIGYAALECLVVACCGTMLPARFFLSSFSHGNELHQCYICFSSPFSELRSAVDFAFASACRFTSTAKKARVAENALHSIQTPGRMAVLQSTAEAIGTLADLDTQNPSLYLNYPQGRVKCPGTLLYTQHKFVTLQLNRSGVCVHNSLAPSVHTRLRSCLELVPVQGHVFDPREGPVGRT